MGCRNLFIGDQSISLGVNSIVLCNWIFKLLYMRLIKMFVLGLAGLFLVVSAIGLLIPNSVKISRAVQVDASSDIVLLALKDVKQWNEWLPWIVADSGAIVQFSAVTNEPGSFIKWQGMDEKNAGKITITATDAQTIYVLHSLKGMNEAKGVFRVVSGGQSSRQSEVQWLMDYKLKWYPWERFLGIFMDQMLGPVLDQGLQNFKNSIEKQVLSS